MGREATGSPEYRNGAWWGRIPDGKGGRSRVELGRWPNTEEGAERAAEAAKHWIEQMRELGVEAVPLAEQKLLAKVKPAVGGETIAAYVEHRWLPDRERRRLTGVDSDKGRLVNHVLPLIGHFATTAPSDELREALRGVVESIDDKVLHGVFGWKTGLLTWGLCTKLFADMCNSKTRALRVRSDNPAANLPGPDRGQQRGKQWLYPSEVVALLACVTLPVRWLRLYALMTYLYLRPEELAALEWGDVHLVLGYVYVHQAHNLRSGKTTPTKTKSTRKVPIPPALVPLFEVLRAETGGKGRVIQYTHANKDAEHGLPPLEDLAPTLRDHLLRAGVTRSDLHEDRPTTKRVTFYDLRATGITWEVLAGTEHVRIMQRAGHVNFSTTLGYVREADAVGLDVGTPFPPLPAAVLCPIQSAKQSPSGADRSAKSLRSRTKLSVPDGIRTSNQQHDLAEKQPDSQSLPIESDRPACTQVPESASGGQSLGDSPERPVEAPLATAGVVAPALLEALELAAQAGRWALATQLATELVKTDSGIAGPLLVKVVNLALQADQWALAKQLVGWRADATSIVDLSAERAKRGVR